MGFSGFALQALWRNLYHQNYLYCITFWITTFEQSFIDFIRKMYSEQLFLPPVTCPAIKPFDFVNFIHIREYLNLFNISHANVKNVFFIYMLKTSTFPAGIYLLTVDNKNTRTRYAICSKLTTKTIEWRHCLYC